MCCDHFCKSISSSSLWIILSSVMKRKRSGFRREKPILTHFLSYESLLELKPKRRRGKKILLTDSDYVLVSAHHRFVFNWLYKLLVSIESKRILRNWLMNTLFFGDMMDEQFMGTNSVFIPEFAIIIRLFQPRIHTLINNQFIHYTNGCLATNLPS